MSDQVTKCNSYKQRDHFQCTSNVQVNNATIYQHALKNEPWKYFICNSHCGNVFVILFVSANMLVCLVKDSTLLPTDVSLVQSKSQQNKSLNKIHIHNYMQSKVVRHITVCAMNVLWGNIKDVSHVRDFIEINNNCGGVYFTMYNYTGLGIEVGKLLWKYITERTD